MSEETIVHIYCDNENCTASIDGFSVNATESFKEQFLENEGWLIAPDGLHFCPKRLLPLHGEKP